MKLIDLKISSLTNPVGIDKAPYFSYVITSDKKDVRQVSFTVKVFKDSQIAWSKTAKTEQSTFIVYEGKLESKTRYDVVIEVTDNHGETDSIKGYFETALLKKSEWKAQWVKSSLPTFEAEKGFAKQPPATMFRKFFSFDGEPVKARLYATCHGIYIPYLNGKRFTKAEFCPEHSTYEKVLFYQSYDVTPYLKKGSNEFSMYVGDGWYLGVKTTPRVKNYERLHAVLFQLEITFSNGTTQIICSDGETECAYGPVESSDLFAGEKYNSNKTFEVWQKAVCADYGFNNLVAHIGTYTELEKEIKVKKVLTTPEGDTILDFGKVLAGRIKVKINEPKNSVISFTHSEVLDEHGNWFENTEMPDGGVEQHDEYVSNGTKAIYEPLFTYHGFRFVKVEGITDLNADDIVACVYSTNMKNVGRFNCSDERLNKLYANIRNSQASNMISIPTDCPQREKAGWTGDIGIYARTALLNEDVTAFLNRWLLSVRADQGENGAVPIVVPYDGGYPMSEIFFGPMFEDTGTIGSAGWGDACVFVPWAVYSVTGNTEVLKDNFDVIEKWCGYILNRCKKDKSYLWKGGYQQGDWLVPSLTEKPLDMMQTIEVQKFTAQYAAPMYGFKSFDLAAKIAEIIGESDKQKYYREVADKMKEAIENELFDENGNLPTDLQGAYIIAVAFDLVPDKFKEHVKEKLITKLKENGGCLNSGFLSTPYLLDAYDKIGRRDLVYKLLFQTESPSWLYQVERGATSVWESWDNYEENGTPKKISYNHYAYGCVDEWIFGNVCGISATKSGFKTFEIKPEPDGRLNFAERSFLSEYGEIYVKWEKSDGEFKLECKIPCNTCATLILPSGRKSTLGSGEYKFAERYKDE